MTLSAADGAILAAAENLSARTPGLTLAPRSPQDGRLGPHRSGRAGAGYEFWQHRPYAVGDAPASVDWRRSARSEDSLLVRERENETAASLAIWTDGSASMDWSAGGRPKKSQRAAVLSMALADAFARGGEPVQIVDGPSGARVGRGAAATLLVDSKTALSVMPPRRAPSRAAALLLVSDFLFALDALGPLLREAASRGVGGALCCVRDPAEETFSQGGRLIVEDAEGGAEARLDAAESIADAYAAAVRAHRAELDDLCRKTGFQLIEARTNDPAETAYRSLVAALAKPPRGGA